MLLLVKLTQFYFPRDGVYIVAAVAGLTDVDAITLSMAEYAKGNSPTVAAIAVVIAAISNTVVKCGMVATLADRRCAADAAGNGGDPGGGHRWRGSDVATPVVMTARLLPAVMLELTRHCVATRMVPRIRCSIVQRPGGDCSATGMRWEPSRRGGLPARGHLGRGKNMNERCAGG